MKQYINKIIQGDCLKVMKEIDNKTINLIYLDPPFNIGIFVKKKDDEFISWIKKVVKECHRVLKDTGSLYLHCDWHANAHIRIMLDKIFGPRNFRNGIVWKRTNSVKSQTVGFGKQYDVIYFYSKSNKITFNIIKKKPDDKYLSSFRYDDGDGKGKYQTVALDNKTTVGGFATMKEYEWKGVKSRWIYSQKTMGKWWEEGKIYTTKNGKYRLKHYLLEAKGPPISDLWVENDVAPLQGGSSEKLGYPTQKPEKLLERIIRASSNEGDVVLDPMCGCGTTLAVAHKLNRKWIGIDSNKKAIELTKERLIK